MPSFRQPYRDRREAGEILAAHLQRAVSGLHDAVVLALPRGGVPVGFEVARALGADLDVLLVRKIGSPRRREFALGAIAEGGVRFLDEELVHGSTTSPAELAGIIEQEEAELQRRERAYRGDQPVIPVEDRAVVLVDDGLATGCTMRAAVAALRARNPTRIIVAAPVGASEACRDLAYEVGSVVCPLQPDPFHAVGLWYHDFRATGDREVCACLAAAHVNFAVAHPGASLSL